MTDAIFFEWVPTVRVGPVHFGDDIADHIKNMPIQACMDPFDENEFLCYGYGEEEEPSYFLDDDGRVEDIVCFDGLIFQDTNLIGLPIDRVIELLGSDPDEYGEEVKHGEGEIRTPVEFDNLGLQLWLRDGIAVSAVVSVANVDDDDEESGD